MSSQSKILIKDTTKMIIELSNMKKILNKKGPINNNHKGKRK